MKKNAPGTLVFPYFAFTYMTGHAATTSLKMCHIYIYAKSVRSSYVHRDFASPPDMTVLTVTFLHMGLRSVCTS